MCTNFLLCQAWRLKLYTNNSVQLLTLGLTGAAQALTLVPPGLAPGSQYRLVFVTDGTRDATSSNIADYNTFVTTQANQSTQLLNLGTTWTAIGSTATVNARTNTNTDPTPAGPNGLPIYVVNGNLVAQNYDDLTICGMDL